MEEETEMKKAVLMVLLGLLAIGGVLVQSTSAHSKGGNGGHHGKQVLKFDTMAGVVEPFTGAAHPVRGIPGGGLPWQIDRADGKLRSDGRLDVKVRGLVLAQRAPVPANLQGTNPIPQFRAAVSCLTPASPDQGENVFTDPVPASPKGNARIRTHVNLPKTCIAPIVFVGSPASATAPNGAWFAATGR
jgi:hypothetical protein